MLREVAVMAVKVAVKRIGVGCSIDSSGGCYVFEFVVMGLL